MGFHPHHDHDHNHDHFSVPHDPNADPVRVKKQERALKAVFGIMSGMFVVEAVTGVMARSTAVVADSMDMFGDAFGAGVSVAVRKSSPRKQAIAALVKAGIMGAVGLSVLGTAAFLIFNPVMPVAATMGIIGGIAFAANATCAGLLWRFRNDNINIKSTLSCIRNDMVSNVALIGAAALSHLLLSPIPDIVMGIAVSGLFVKSAFGIAKEAIGILKREKKKEKEAAQKNAPAVELEPAPKLTFRQKLGRVFNKKATPQKQDAKPAAAPKAATAPKNAA